MAKYQFTVDAKAYIEEMRPHMKASSVKDKERKLLLISNMFTSLYREGKVSSNNPRRITREDVVAYVAYRRENGISESTISKDICLLNQLLLWVGNHEVENFRAFAGVLKPRSYTGRKPAMEDVVIDRVMRLARETDDWKTLLGCTVVVVCTSCGLRPQEARQLYADDVTLVDGRSVVHVEHVKGEGSWGHSRNVLVMDGAEDILRKYLSARESMLRAHGKTTRAMFTPLNNDNEFYSQQGFGCLKQGIERAVGAKFQLRSGRRAYGQRLLNRGNSLEDVSVSMGHSSTKTTEEYYARYKEKDVMRRIMDRGLR
ncbi:MAG: site-specific integrase [Candidatus Methanomethylophilaceae archaeon]|nr:site-specific integrase [Candidatus Methanomethylophilaceae archaeon]